VSESVTASQTESVSESVSLSASASVSESSSLSPSMLRRQSLGLRDKTHSGSGTTQAPAQAAGGPGTQAKEEPAEEEVAPMSPQHTAQSHEDGKAHQQDAAGHRRAFKRPPPSKKLRRKMVTAWLSPSPGDTHPTSASLSSLCLWPTSPPTHPCARPRTRYCSRTMASLCSSVRESHGVHVQLTCVT